MCPRTGLVPSKIWPTLAVYRGATIIRVTAARVTIPHATVLGAIAAKPIDTTTIPKLGGTGRAAVVWPAGTILRVRAVAAARAVLGGASAEAVPRAAVAEAAPDARGAVGAEPVRRDRLGSDGGDAHVVVEPQVRAVVLEVRVPGLQLAEVEPETLVDGRAVVAGHDEVVRPALVYGPALGRVRRRRRRVVRWRPCGAWRRDGCVGLGKCASGCAVGLVGSWVSLISFVGTGPIFIVRIEGLRLAFYTLAGLGQFQNNYPGCWSSN